MRPPLLLSIAVTLLGIGAALGTLAWGIGNAAVYRESVPVESAPHFFGAPERSIEEIEVRAFYFVPRDKERAAVGHWREILTGALDSLVQFHSLETRGRSRITYTIYPAVILGEQGHLVYDSESTQRGNPHALISVGEEIERRVARPDGDLYRVEFASRNGETEPSRHTVFFIMYEGVGAVGGMIHESARESAAEIAREIGIPEDVVFVVNIESADGFFLVNREFVDGLYGPHGASIVAHEFYHTLGVPDAYLAHDETPTSADLMGLGRFRPLETTYLGREVLEGMGL
jgi:hypothetical protein